MFQAPTSETKQHRDRTKTTQEPQPDRELRPRRGVTLTQGWSSGAGGESAPTPASARGLDHWAGLHRAYGNQAVLRSLQAGLTPGAVGSLSQRQPLVRNRGVSLRAQTKLTINTPGDRYEQEADRVAEQVMRIPDPNVAASPAMASAAPVLQRKCACGGSGEGSGTCSECAKKEELQRSAVGPSAVPEAPPIVHDVLGQPGRPLDANTRAFFESRFGQDLGPVRVHTDWHAAKSAQSIGALAYTVGDHVVFGPEQYMPATTHGGRLIAHELAHVVQQSSRPSVPRLIAGRYLSVMNDQSTVSRQQNPTQTTTTKHAKAVEDHLQDQKDVNAWIGLTRELLSFDPSRGLDDPGNLLYNSAEFILDKRASLRVLSLTDDADIRNKQRGRAFFDDRVTFPNIEGDYPADIAITDDAAIRYQTSSSVLGETIGTTVRLYVGNMKRPVDFEELQRVLVHEVQHVADRNREATVGNPQTEHFETYKSEFRAFWIEPEPPPSAFPIGYTQNFGPPVTASNKYGIAVNPQNCPATAGCKSANQTVSTHFKNLRQENIAHYIMENYQKQHYDCFYVCDPNFRQKVDDYALSESANLINSIRIDKLVDAIKAVGLVWKADPKSVNPKFLYSLMQWEVIMLEPLDLEVLRDEKKSESFWSYFREQIPPQLQKQFSDDIKTGVPWHI
jgi:hypothetical protein